MSEYNDEYYYQKYLKYKNKYLELKQYEGGANFMPTFQTGVYVYFCTQQDADNICKEVDKKTTNIMSIHNILTKDPTKLAFYAKQGATKITQVEKYRTASVGEGIASRASSAFSTMAKSAKTVGSAMAKGAQKVIDPKTYKSNVKRSDIIIPISGGGPEPIQFDLKDSQGVIVKLNTANYKYLESLLMFIHKDYPHIDTIIKITYSPMGSNICNYKKTLTNDEFNPDKKQVGQEQVEELSTNLVLPEQLSDTPTEPRTVSQRIEYRGRALAESARARVAEAKAAEAKAAKAAAAAKARPPMTRANTTPELLRRSTSD
jgi:hypothetical protein